MLNLPAFSWLEKVYTSQIFTRCDELTAMSYFAESGQGVALLPHDQTREGLKCCLELNHIAPSEIWLLTHPDLRHLERIRLVMQCLTEFFGSLKHRQ